MKIYEKKTVGFFKIQDKVVETVNDGVASGKATIQSAAETISENVENLKDKAGKLSEYLFNNKRITSINKISYL